MIFKDREHAARLLLQKLAKYQGQKPLVLGIPRGAVPMAKIIADGLKGDLDVVLVHKLGAPGQPEFAIGAVDEKGRVYLTDVAAELEISAQYLAREKEEQLENSASTPRTIHASPFSYQSLGPRRHCCGQRHRHRRDHDCSAPLSPRATSS